MSTPPNQPRFVDMRIPLPWLITAVVLSIGALGSTVWTVAGQSNDLKLLVSASSKMEKRLDDREIKTETRAELLNDRLSTVDRTTDNLKLRVDALERLRK